MELTEIKMRSLPNFSLLAMLVLLSAAALPAQDSRKVTEPRIPVACVTLNAIIEASNGVISDRDEQSLDTVRIQSAIDKCGEGKAVLLRSRRRKNVFLTGPIELRSGVTLVIDAGASLVASRDPRLYDLVPGSCGIVAEKGHGCKPLI